MFYLFTILGAMALIALFNLLFPAAAPGFTAGYVIVAVLLQTVEVIAVDGIFAFAIRRLPERWFSPERRFFRVSKREVDFYRTIKIKSWKDKVLELGCFTSFSKSHFTDPGSAAYTYRFLLESAYGIVIHLVGIPMGFLIVFFCPLEYALRFGVPVALVNALLNLLPLFILRYHFPPILRMYRHNLKKEAAAAARSEGTSD